MAALELDRVDKRFGAIHAVRSASLAFERGRIHAVVGENGAGKSTLLRIAAGLLAPDRGGHLPDGSVRVAGRALEPHTPAEAIRRGVAMVQQHFALVEGFTALENIVLGAEPVRSPFGRLDLAAARGQVAATARELGAEIPLGAPVRSLGIGDRQRLEIVRALYRKANVLILDEPTAVLTPGEATALYLTLRRLADAGRTVIVVTHKLDEVRLHADVATVMRHGSIVETRDVERSDEGVSRLAGAIMGEGITASVAIVKRGRAKGEPVILVKGLRVGRRLRGVSLEVRAGEIVGVAGVEGNGQRELVRALAGLEPDHEGTIVPDAAALAIVHEDRHQEGLVLGATTRDNVVLGELARFSRGGLVDEDAVDEEARARVARAQAPPALDAVVRTLSGGNQQKLVVARSIARIEAKRARALVAAHPTRGVDLAASRAIHVEIVAAAERGAAVLVVSADLHELRSLADRLLVLGRGEIRAELPPDASDAEIGRAMLAGGDAPAVVEEVRA